MVTLKQLCEYYLECISIDNANDISVVIRPNSIDYAELDSFDLNTFNPNVTQLIQRISASPKQVLSYIGYPVLVTGREKKQRKAIPILLFETHVNAGNVTISYPPQINKDFLKHYTSTPKKLGEEIINLEKELDLNSSTSHHTISDLVQKLRRTKTWQWMEDPNPDNLNTTPLLNIRPEGIYNIAILLSTNANPYTQGLEKELKELSQKINIQNTALEEWLSPTIALQKTNPLVQVLDVYPMNREQRLAVQTALTNKLTVITGPPGTGKSQVVANIIANAAYHGKSVLFTSKNHKAVDVVVQRIQDLTDKNNLYPLIIRAGNCNENLATNLKNIIEKILTFYDQLPTKSIIPNTHNNQKLLDCSKTLDELYTQKNDYIKLRNEVDALEQITTVNNFREKWGDPLIKITSDEVASFNEIKQSFTHTYLKWLKTRNSFWGKIFWFLLKKRKNRTLNQELDKLNNWLSQKEITPISLNINSYNTQDYKTIRTNLKFIYNEIRAISYFLEALKKLLQEKNLIELDKEITTKNQQIHSLSKTIFFNWLNSKNQPLSPTTRIIFNNFLTQLKTNPDNVWGSFSDSIKDIINNRQLPSCAITALSARNKIPFEPGFFDLVIIDEASQCDIASALPMLYRAKQAVILGDTKQLSFFTNLSKKQDYILLSQNNLGNNKEYSFSQMSLYDLAFFKNANAIKLLEHHRSNADIINFSNKVFYTNELRIATKYSNLVHHPYQKAIYWSDCKGITERPNVGSAINRAECQQIIRELYSLKQTSYKGSIGIISPFRKQANYIREEIIKDKNLLHFRINNNIEIGTVHQFQGNEKDLIFFSPTISDQAAESLITFLAENKELFNVAITRARSQFVIVGNYQYCASCRVPHLRELTTYMNELAKYNTAPKHPPVFESIWEEKLYYALLKEGIFTNPQHPVDQYRLDMAIILENGAKLDIEVDGENYHKTLSGEYCFTDLLRNQHLHDQGWDVKRFWVYQIRENLQDCINEIKDWMHTNSQPLN